MDSATKEADANAPTDPASGTRKDAYWGLTFASLGIVFGDIGTSPLYALREALSTVGQPSEAEVVGIVSLLIWSLLVVVTLKYVLILLRADNRGEGGTLSLLALAQNVPNGRGGIILFIGIIAAGLFYGDAVLTPAISVLSAVEGLEVAVPSIGPVALPIAATILVLLFLMQGHGTGRIGVVFAPVTLIWFLALTAIGLVHISDAPQVLWALSPVEAGRFLIGHGVIGFLTLGSVFLAVTGAEALYADMGHFGRGPIRTAWFVAVLPALVVTYLGQGALAILRPEAIGNLFFVAFPVWAQLPMVILATLATVIASQAVITGTYSLTWQAVRLGLLPRFRVLHTSSRLQGQIYLPRVNLLMLLGVLGLLLFFQKSSGLAGAYGIAVSGTMVVTTLMAAFVFVKAWHWRVIVVVALLAPLLFVDVVFLSANLAKIDDGGYVPLIVASIVMVVIWTWVRGVRLVAEQTRRDSVTLADLMASLKESSVARVNGTAVFLTGTPELAPPALMHNIKHNRVLHRHNIIVTVRTAPRPRVKKRRRAIVAPLGEDFTAVELSYGFMETPDVSRGLMVARAAGLEFDPATASYFISRRSFRPISGDGMPPWQDRLFIALTRFADDASDYFALPTNRVVELGSQINL